MTRSLLLICVLGGTVLSSGCISTNYMQLPTWLPRHPKVEQRSFTFSDPFPDSNIGPDISQRPRGFNRPRTGVRSGQKVRTAVDILRQSGSVPDSRMLRSTYPVPVQP